MKLTKNRLFLIAFLSLAGCTHSPNTAYLESRNGPGLTVPPTLTGEHLSQRYYLDSPQRPVKVNLAPPQ
jgi:hypothetical protein